MGGMSFSSYLSWVLGTGPDQKAEDVQSSLTNPRRR